MVVSKGSGKGQQQFNSSMRKDEATAYPQNLMYDRRVVRGNTYAAQVLPAEPHIQPSSQPKRKPKPKPLTQKPTTPAPVEGRTHVKLQTDRYLEELTDVISEQNNATQTDAFLDRPPTPLYIPQKSGLDIATQIEEGDLFDFDFEVQPILEALVGRVLESCLMEVVEEEEIANLKQQQEQFEAQRTAELVAVQRMEEAEKRKVEEKERRFQQEAQRVKQEEEVRKKVAAQTFARGYLSGLYGSVVEKLKNTGFFYDPVQREVEDEFMPWLLTRALARIEVNNVARKVTQQLIRNSMEASVKLRKAAEEKRQKQEEAAQAYEAKVSEAQKQMAEQLAKEQADKATFVLYDMHPRLVHDDVISQTRSRLEGESESKADAAWEEAKQQAGQKRREEAKVELEKWQEEVAAQRGEGDEGAELPPPPFDVEAEVQAAKDSVPKPDPQPVTDEAVLASLMASGAVTKDRIVHNLALHSMGDEAYSVDPLFVDEVQPVAPA